MGINELKPDDLEKVNGGTEPPKFWTPEAKAMAEKKRAELRMLLNGGREHEHEGGKERTVLERTDRRRTGKGQRRQLAGQYLEPDQGRRGRRLTGRG